MKIKDVYLSQDDDDDKVEIINSLNFDDYEDKWELILEVIQDESEYDLARIEALKVIEVNEIPESIVDKLCATVANLCQYESDYDVKNYSFIASRNLINYSLEIKNSIKETVLSREEDIDLRHNAYSAVLRLEDKNEKANILNLLLEDEVFSKYAKKDLS